METTTRVAIVMALCTPMAALAQTPPSPTTLRAQALVHLERNEIAAARRVIDEGLRAAPTAGPLLEAQGQLYWRLLQTASAIAAFERASADAAVTPEALVGLGRIYAFRGWRTEGAFPGWHEEVDQRAKALAAFRRAAELRPGWPVPPAELAAIARLEGQTTTPPPADPDQAALAEIDAALKTSPAAAAARARTFITERPFSPRLLDAYDRLLTAYQGWTEAPTAEVVAAIDARIALRPDPGAYYLGANVLLARRTELRRVRALAEAGAAAGEQFIVENRPSYKLEGKFQASRDRNRAAAADLIGWAAFLENDRATAATKLEEAARLSSGNDFVNQFHRAELARALGDTDTARERYYEALSLQGGPPALRDASRAALAAIYAAEGTPAAEAATAIDRDLERRREDRRRALVSSALGRALPALSTTDLAGAPVDLRADHGRVTLLNFFAAWCGACRQELPLIQKAYDRYQNDPSVRFVLVSLDDDPKRLERYLAERKFAMPVLRMTREAAAAALDVQDTPWTFYVDAAGTIRYEVRGLEPHGDAVARISWYIDQLKADRSAAPH